MKLHLACGDVYLKGYINIDIDGFDLYDVVEEYKIGNFNETTLDNYFKFPFGFPKRNIIVDKFMNLTRTWDILDNSVEEIVMISAIEHFTKNEAIFIMSEIKRVLEPNGKLILDFPDIMEDVELYQDNPEFLMTLIYCNQKNENSIHKWGYNRSSIKTLLGEGWKSIEFKRVVKHDYPMIPIVAIKE